MIALFVTKDNDEATMPLAQAMQALDLPADVQVTINNTQGSKSGVLLDNGKVVDISLAGCYSLEDVVCELVRLLAEGEAAREERCGLEGF